MGGFPAQPEEEAWGLLIEVNFILPPFLVVSGDSYSTIPLFPFLSFLL